MSKLFVCFLFAVLFAACTSKELRIQEYELSKGTPNPAKAPEEFYTVGPGDVLGILIWKEPSLSGPAAVRPDGFITLPLINEVQVVGLTTAQLRKILEQKYKEFVTTPHVTIRIEGIRSNEIFLIGQVAHAGAFPLMGNETLLQLITRAGGLTIFASRQDIRLLRRDGDKVTEYVVDYDAIIKGDLKQDLLLRPGDRIIVP